jgi:diguanylate cyclase (GGDEF)-like protein/PAS domain S-box-containing protein
MVLVNRLMAAFDGLRQRVPSEAHADATRAQTMLDSIGDAVVSADNAGSVTYLNRAAEAMTGWSREEAAGRPCMEVLRLVDRETRAVARNPISLAVELDRTVGLTPNCLLIRRDGQEVAVEDSAAPLHDMDGQVTGAIMVFRDVGAALGMSREMAHRAQHDVLTGLPNRLLMNDRLIEAIGFARRHGTLVAVLFLDVDGFKNVNDTLGHAAADRVLGAIAERLRGSLRSSDTVSRYGGDEFVIILPEIERAWDAAVVASTILRAVAAPHVVGSRDVTVTVSMGVSVYPDHGDDAETLLANADAAMYDAKRTRPGTYRLSTSRAHPRSLASRP